MSLKTIALASLLLAGCEGEEMTGNAGPSATPTPVSGSVEGLDLARYNASQLELKECLAGQIKMRRWKSEEKAEANVLPIGLLMVPSEIGRFERTPESDGKSYSPVDLSRTGWILTPQDGFSSSIESITATFSVSPSVVETWTPSGFVDKEVAPGGEEASRIYEAAYTYLPSEKPVVLAYLSGSDGLDHDAGTSPELITSGGSNFHVFKGSDVASICLQIAEYVPDLTIAE